MGLIFNANNKFALYHVNQIDAERQVILGKYDGLADKFALTVWGKLTSLRVSQTFTWLNLANHNKVSIQLEFTHKFPNYTINHSRPLLSKTNQNSYTINLLFI